MDARFRTRVGAAALAALTTLALAACTNSSTGAGVVQPVAPVAAASTTQAPGTSSAAPATTTSAPVTVSSLTSDGTAASGSSSSSTTTSSSTTVAPPKPKPPAPKFAVSPAFGSTGLSPTVPISITATNGTLVGLTVTNPEGKAVTGTLSADRTTWTLAEPLGYDSTYTVAGSVVGAGGKAKIAGTYGTATPDDVINASISPNDETGTTVGIAAPILISLGTDITDPQARARIEKAITVTTVPKTEGAFAWIQHDDGIGLDWRPKNYWKPGTKVTVTANLYGVNYGGNLWGKEDLTQSFDIGRSEVTKGDIDTHRLVVYRDGKVLFDFPTSFGLESDPGRVTRGGTYFVMSKEYLHLMSNPAYHYKNFPAYYAVRISNNGTFIHANDGTDDVQGYENVTHGCANLSTENAKAFYDQTMYGDPVEISNSSIPLSAADGDNHDWSIPWSEWQTLSANASQQG